MPLTSTQALNGLSDGPVLRMIGCSLSRMNSLAAQDRAAQGAALAVDVLGGGVHDDVGAEFERPLQHRRGEGVVEHDLGAGLVREVAHRLDVDDVEHRVGGRFEQHGLRRLRQRLLPLREVAAVDELALDAVLGQQLVHDVVARAEQLARRDDAVAGLEQRQQGEEHRRHAGRGGAAGLGAFERGEAVLEHRDGRIAEARILEVRALALEGRLGLLGAVVGVARGQEERLRRLVEVAAHLAAAHRARLRLPGLDDRAPPSCAGIDPSIVLSSRPRLQRATKKPPTWKDGGFCEHLRPFSED